MSIETYRPFTNPIPRPAGCHVADPVGILEIAARLGVHDRSVHAMRRRGSLPEPDWPSVNGFRTWDWRTILWWAGETGRLRSPDLIAEFTETFKSTPPTINLPGPTPRTRRPPGVTRGHDPMPGVPAVPTGIT